MKKAIKLRKKIDAGLAQKCFDMVGGAVEPVVFDIGAHKGRFLEGCYNRNKKAVLVAVDPFEENLICIRERLPDANLRIIQGAVWSHGTGLKLYTSTKGGTKDASLLPESVVKLGYKVGGEREVEALSMDGVVDKAVDIMFINCEGAEYEILLNRTGWMDKVKTLYIHLHTKSEAFMASGYREKRKKIMIHLRERGYSFISGIEDIDFKAHLVQLWGK